MARRKKPNTPTKRKMSDMISEMAAGFLGVGDTIGERQNRLNAACNAWNIALVPPLARPLHIQKFRKEYLRFNSATSPGELANIVKDLETLIERKVKLFPDDKRQIVNSRVIKVGNAFRIEIVSVTIQ